MYMHNFKCQPASTNRAIKLDIISWKLIENRFNKILLNRSMSA